jgi:hypothetical protein
VKRGARTSSDGVAQALLEVLDGFGLDEAEG